MKNITITFVWLLLFVCLAGSPVLSQGEQEINKSFSNKDEVKIKLVLGDCDLIRSSDDQIHVRVLYSYDESSYETRFRERDESLVMQEKFHNGDSPKGDSHWTVAVPSGVEVDFESATGNLNVEGVNGEIDGNSGTGKIEVREGEGKFELNSGTGNLYISDCKGDFELNSGTGNVRLENCSGEFQANSGTGDVEAFNITIKEDGEFNSGTGDVEVVRPMGDDFDLSINSGTDDATLDLDGLPVKGYFELSADRRSGRIKSAIEFDEEEEFNDTLRKSFTRDGRTPRYFIRTGTGTAELKK